MVDGRVACGGRFLALAAGGLLVLAGCQSHQQRIERFTELWGQGEFAPAEAELDQLIADRAGVDVSLVAESRGLDEALDPRKGDLGLLLMEKSLTRLAQGDLGAAIDLLRRMRDVLGERFNAADVAGYLGAALGDDAMLDFTGADYEHVLVPAVLTIADLLEGGQDAYAYALQIGEVQERILGSTFGDELPPAQEGAPPVSYNPRRQYQRVAIGAYLEGVLRESAGFRDEAAKAYARARQWGGDAPAIVQACERTSDRETAAPGSGFVHVFCFAGSGPRLMQGTSPVTEQARMLAYIGSFMVGRGVGVIGQTAVPVPVVLVRDAWPVALRVRAGETEVEASMLLDLNTVAAQQLEANLPWIVARAVLRRAVKAVAAKIAQDAAGRDDPLLGLLAGIGTNLALTAGERADTRNWTALPAQIQALRLPLPAGEHELDLGAGLRARVRVAAGRDSYVLVMRPQLGAPGVALVDRWSQMPAAVPVAP